MRPSDTYEEDGENELFPGSNLEVALPTDLMQWDQLRALLEEMRSCLASCVESQRTLLFLSFLQNARQLVLNAHSQLPEPPFYAKGGWCLGLGTFLTDCLSMAEREHFFESTLPSIVQLVINLDFYRPDGAVTYSLRQRERRFALARGFVASLLGSAFLCLFPERCPILRESTSEINFFALFREVSPEQPHLAHKLRCFLNYFDNVMLLPAAQLAERVIFQRLVLPPALLLSPEELLNSDLPLCELRFESSSALETASKQLMHIDFASSFVGGGVLRKEVGQEEIKILQCPELLAAALFMESLDDNEVVLMANYRPFSRCRGRGSDFRFLGSLGRAQVRSETPLLCAIDALPFYSWYEQDQFLLENVMRELNKAYTGFSQSKIRVVDGTLRDLPAEKSDASGSEESEVEEFAGSLVHRALDTALQELPFRRASSCSLPSDILHSRSFSSSSRSSFTSRSSRRGSSRRSSELSSCAANEESAVGGGDFFRDTILEEEMTEEEEEEEEEDGGREDGPLVAPPILLEAPISDASKLSLSQEYLGSRGSPGPTSPTAFACSRFAARRNSSPLRLGQRVEQRRSSIPSHIRLLPLPDSAKIAANSCCLPGYPRVPNSSDSERLSVRSFRSCSSSANCALDPDEAGSALEVWAGALAQHVVRDALAEVGDRFCVTETFADELSHRLLAEAVTAAALRLPDREAEDAEVEAFAEATVAEIMAEAVGEAAEASVKIEAYAHHLSRRIMRRAVRSAVQDSQRLSFSSAASSLSIEDFRDFESRLSHDADQSAPFVAFPSAARTLESFGSRLSAHLVNSALTDPRLSLPREEPPFFDALDVPFWLVEKFADKLSRESVLGAQLAVHKKVTGATAMGIATGNWGCGSQRGDPQLKCFIQWLAASVSRSPLLLYHSFGDVRLLPLLDLAEDIRARRLMVGDLFALLQEFCALEGPMGLADFVRVRLTL